MGFMDGVRRGLNGQDRNGGGNGFNGGWSDSSNGGGGWDDWNPPPENQGFEAERAVYREAIERLLADKEQEREQYQRAIQERDRWVLKSGELARVGEQNREGNAALARELSDLRARLLRWESIIGTPRVWNAARKAALAEAHPDGGKTEAERRARTMWFQEIDAEFERIKTKS